MGESMPLLRKSSCSMFLLSPYVPEREAGMERRSNVAEFPPKTLLTNRRLLEKRKLPVPTGRVGFSNSARAAGSNLAYCRWPLPGMMVCW